MYQYYFKPCLDFLLALFAISCALPLIIVVFLIGVCKQENYFFSQTRIGLRGRAFKIFKFRTMVPNADLVLEKLLCDRPDLRAEWEKYRKLTKDPRVTQLGHFLRKFKLDEILQLINVLKGEMSLIGPRPLMEDEVERYFSPGNKAQYFSVKPGITGAWACQGRASASMAYKKRIEVEVQYTTKVTLVGDIRISLITVKEIFNGNGA